MKNERKKLRSQYTAQFYRNNRAAFLTAVLSTLLIAALNLWISWVMQQMIDTVSGVPGALPLSALALHLFGIIVMIVVFKALSYLSKPRFMEKAMRQYKDYAFRKLTQKASRPSVRRIRRITYRHFPTTQQVWKITISKSSLILWQMESSCSAHWR